MARIFLIALGVILMIVAQPVQAGSVFSTAHQGFGLKNYLVSVRGLGAGGTGLANPDSISLNYYTVSHWRFVRHSRAMVGFQYNRQFSEYGQQNFTTGTGHFGGLGLAVPIKQQRWVLGISLQPYSGTDFRYVLKRPVDEENNMFQSILIQGNLSKAQGILSFAPHPRLGLAMSAAYYFGNFKEEYRLQYEDLEHSTDGYRTEFQIYGAGLGFSVDAQPFSSLRLAAYLELEPSLRLKRVINTTVLDSTTRLSSLNAIPLQFGVGSQIQFSSRWQAMADFSYQDLRKSSVKGAEALDLWYFLGLGLEHLNGGRRAKKFFDRIDTRIGFSVSRLGYRFQNHPVYQYAGHLGVGIPFLGHGNRFDVALVGGIRGNKARHGAEERFVQLQMSVSVGERWFQRFE